MQPKRVIGPTVKSKEAVIKPLKKLPPFAIVWIFSSMSKRWPTNEPTRRIKNTFRVSGLFSYISLTPSMIVNKAIACMIPLFKFSGMYLLPFIPIDEPNITSSVFTKVPKPGNMYNILSMKAILLKGFGGVENLELVSHFPNPNIEENEVLIRVKAVALNHLDVWVRMGALAVKPELPHILGSDVSGIVEKVGKLVRSVKEGDEVILSPGLSCTVCYDCLSGRDNLCKHYDILGLKTKGGYAEYVKVPESNVVPKPKNLSFEEASSFPLTYLTVWNALVRKGSIKPNSRVFIWAGSSGVGVAAVQLAKLMGAFVIATAGNEEKAKKCKELGADMVIDHYRDDVVKRVRDVFRDGVDIVVDHVGEKTFWRSIECLRKGGKLVFFGTTTGSSASIDIRYLFVREIELLGVYMGPKSDLIKIAELFERGALKPVVDRVFRLEDAASAHQYLESSKHFGKVVLRVL